MIFLVSNGAGGDPAVDYDAANVAQLSVLNQADGTANGSFQVKTNQPFGNSQFQNLAAITCPSPLGVWSLTFLNDTNVTMSGPAGVSTNFNLPDAQMAAQFANPLTVYFGNQQNGPNYAGQAATYSEFKVSGVTASPEIDDTFPGGTLNTTNWQVDAYAANDIFIVRPADKFWVSWTIPDSGFTLQSNTNLAAGTWIDAGISNIVTSTVGKKVVVPANVSDNSSGFFRMTK